MAEKAGGSGAAHDATVVTGPSAPTDDKAARVARINEAKDEVTAAQTAVDVAQAHSAAAEDALVGAKARLAELKGAD